MRLGGGAGAGGCGAGSSADIIKCFRKLAPRLQSRRAPNANVRLAQTPPQVEGGARVRPRMKLISLTSENVPFPRSQRLSDYHDSAVPPGSRQVFNIDAPPFCLRHQ